MTVDWGVNCEDLVEMITDYLEGELPAKEVQLLERHLELCDGCRTYLEQMRQVIASAGKLEDRHIPSQAKDKLLKVFRDWKKDVRR